MPSDKDIETFVQAAHSYVERALGLSMEMGEDSLAFVDHYVTTAREAALKNEVLALVAPALGAWLGEVAIAKFGGRWVMESENPAEWRVEVEPVPLRFWPVGMAAEALRGDEVEGYDASFTVFGPGAPALMQKLLEALSRVPPVEHAYYYSLTGRLETLTHAVDILTSLKAPPPESPDSDPESESESD